MLSHLSRHADLYRWCVVVLQVDSLAPHVREAKHAVYLGSNPRDYTNKEKLLQVRTKPGSVTIGVEQSVFPLRPAADTACARHRQHAAVIRRHRSQVLTCAVLA